MIYMEEFLTAQEARELSSDESENIFTRIERLIRSAAAQGRRAVSVIVAAEEALDVRFFLSLLGYKCKSYAVIHEKTPYHWVEEIKFEIEW